MDIILFDSTTYPEGADLSSWTRNWNISWTRSDSTTGSDVYHDTAIDPNPVYNIPLSGADSLTATIDFNVSFGQSYTSSSVNHSISFTSDDNSTFGFPAFSDPICAFKYGNGYTLTSASMHGVEYGDAELDYFGGNFVMNGKFIKNKANTQGVVSFWYGPNVANDTYQDIRVDAFTRSTTTGRAAYSYLLPHMKTVGYVDPAARCPGGVVQSSDLIRTPVPTDPSPSLSGEYYPNYVGGPVSIDLVRYDDQPINSFSVIKFHRADPSSITVHNGTYPGASNNARILRYLDGDSTGTGPNTYSIFAAVWPNCNPGYYVDGATGTATLFAPSQIGTDLILGAVSGEDPTKLYVVTSSFSNETKVHLFTVSFSGATPTFTFVGSKTIGTTTQLTERNVAMTRKGLVVTCTNALALYPFTGDSNVVTGPDAGTTFTRYDSVRVINLNHQYIYHYTDNGSSLSYLTDDFSDYVLFLACDEVNTYIGNAVSYNKAVLVTTVDTSTDAVTITSLSLASLDTSSSTLVTDTRLYSPNLICGTYEVSDGEHIAGMSIIPWSTSPTPLEDIDYNYRVFTSTAADDGTVTIRCWTNLALYGPPAVLPFPPGTFDHNLLFDLNGVLRTAAGLEHIGVPVDFDNGFLDPVQPSVYDVN